MIKNKPNSKLPYETLMIGFKHTGGMITMATACPVFSGNERIKNKKTLSVSVPQC